MLDKIVGPIMLLGDTHGRHEGIRSLCKQNTDKTILHVGDVGIGFGDDWPSEMNPVTNFKFIHGNHDNADRCKLYTGYLGRYGWFEWQPSISSVPLKIFFCSGAWSIDWQHREPGKTWWETEELTQKEMDAAAILYAEIKPDIVISHDCPAVLWKDLIKQIQMLFGDTKIETRTGNFLDRLFRIHQPSQWYFGHYHGTARIDKENCRFRCLNVGETCSLSI